MENKNIKYIIDYLKKLAYSCVSDRLSKILSSVMICISLIFTISVCWQLSLNSPYVVPDMLFGVTFVISILLAVILFIFLFFKKYRPYAKVFFCTLIIILYGAVKGCDADFIDKKIPKNFVIDKVIESSNAQFVLKIKEFKGDYNNLIGTHRYVTNENDKENYIKKLYTGKTLEDFVKDGTFMRDGYEPPAYIFLGFFKDFSKEIWDMLNQSIRSKDCYFGVNDTGNSIIIYNPKTQILFYLGV